MSFPPRARTQRTSFTERYQAWFLPCDLAAAQLDYGLADPAGKYADCFAISPGDGVKGLNTSLTQTAGTSFTKCVGLNHTVAGRLALASSGAYIDMANTPLAGRALVVEGKNSPSTTWTQIGTATATNVATGNNWTKAITSSVGGTWNYRATWTTNANEPAINTSNTVTWNITWTTIGCPT